MRYIQPPKPEQREIFPYSYGEICALLEATKASRLHLRDRAIILLLVDSGIRADELCNITMNDLSTFNRHILIHGKGKKERQIKISEETLVALQAYCATIKPRPTGTRPLISSCYSKKKLNRTGLRLIIRRLGERSGVANCHPHRFRHTFAILIPQEPGKYLYPAKAVGALHVRHGKEIPGHCPKRSGPRP